MVIVASITSLNRCAFMRIISTSACPYVRGHMCVAVHAKKTKKLSNHVPETTTTQAVPSLSRARTCVAIRAWPYVQKKKLSNHVPETTTTQAVLSLLRGRTCVAIRAKKQTNKQKTFKQPHRPFLRSRVLATTTRPHTELIKVQIKIKFTSLSLLAMTFAAM